MAMNLDLPIRGLVAGLIIAAPVGPVNVLCIQRTLKGGRKKGILSGLGAALADTLYGAIAGFSINIVIQFLIRQQATIQLLGGILLTAIGVVCYFRPARAPQIQARRSSGNSEFVPTFFLALTNPTTVLSFLAVLATLGLGAQRPLWHTWILILGIFCGSMTWWAILASAADSLRSRITDRNMQWMNRVAGIAIGGFGLVNILLSRGHGH